MKGVLFDLDGTLFDRDATVRALVEAQRAAFAPALAGLAATDLVARVLELDDHGLRDKTEVYATIAREVRCRTAWRASWPRTSGVATRPTAAPSPTR